MYWKKKDRHKGVSRRGAWSGRITAVSQAIIGEQLPLRAKDGGYLLS